MAIRIWCASIGLIALLTAEAGAAPVAPTVTPLDLSGSTSFAGIDVDYRLGISNNNFVTYLFDFDWSAVPDLTSLDPSYDAMNPFTVGVASPGGILHFDLDGGIAQVPFFLAASAFVSPHTGINYISAVGGQPGVVQPVPIVTSLGDHYDLEFSGDGCNCPFPITGDLQVALTFNHSAAPSPSPVPEPGTLALVSIGVVVGYRRRRLPNVAVFSGSNGTERTRFDIERSERTR